ncbi:MAG: aminotransferase class IV, partial [Nitrospirota bacterium]
MLIFINGNLLPQDEAKVSVLDRGFLYGDGVFETLRAYSGKIFCLNDHVNRLFRSANAIYIKTPFTKDYVEEALYRTL